MKNSLPKRKISTSTTARRKKEMQEILTVKSNVNHLLFPPQKDQPERENER